MSIATLSRMTVPLDTGDSPVTQGLLMPKLQYRFRTTFNNFGVSTPTTELTKQVIDVTRPTVSFDPITLDVYNSRINLAGKHTWDSISVNLRDDATAQIQRLVGEQLQKQVDFYEQSSAASGLDYKFTMAIEILDGGNGAFEANILETFELYGCFLENVAYQQLSYATSDAVTIALTVKYDNAIQTPQGTGIGTNVGRTLNTLSTGGGI
jgi:hypothetical protein